MRLLNENTVSYKQLIKRAYLSLKDKIIPYKRNRRLSPRKVKVIANHLFYEIFKCCAEKKSVYIDHFGTFYLIKYHKSYGYNIKDGMKKIPISERYIIKFKMSTRMKKKLREGI